MPCYTFYLSATNTTHAASYKKQAKIGEDLDALHEQTFGSPAAHVRVEFENMVGNRVVRFFSSLFFSDFRQDFKRARWKSLT